MLSDGVIHNVIIRVCPGGSSSVGRASAFQAGCREFESRLPLQTIQISSPETINHEDSTNEDNHAHVAQSVERFLGKEEVHRFDSGRGLQHFTTQDS